MADKKLTNDLDTDYRLAGIATSLKEYKLCYYLNRLLDCDFKKLEPLTFEPKDRSRKIQFSVFKAEQGDTNNAYIVFTNKNMGEFLLPEVSNFDYIVQITGKFKDENMRKMLDGIKKLEEVVLSTRGALAEDKKQGAAGLSGRKTCATQI